MIQGPDQSFLPDCFVPSAHNAYRCTEEGGILDLVDVPGLGGRLKEARLLPGSRCTSLSLPAGACSWAVACWDCTWRSRTPSPSRWWPPTCPPVSCQASAGSAAPPCPSRTCCWALCWQPRTPWPACSATSQLPWGTAMSAALRAAQQPVPLPASCSSC